MGSWHALDTADVLARLESAPDGLSGDEAAARLARHGPNALEVRKPVSAWRILLDQFRSVIVLLLVGAAIVAWIFGDAIEAFAILGVLVINAALGFATELRARTAMAALLRLEVPHATVLRDGASHDVSARDLVPGDVLLLEAGQSVPADARLLEATELRTAEAALTGESQPVAKDARALLADDTSLAERSNMVYMSTAVVAGSARAVVTGTAAATEVGHIGRLVGGIEDERTPLEQKLDQLGRRLVWVTLGVAVVVVVVGLARGDELARLIETALALAIAAVPEGLPTVSTIALAVGVARMARRNALVRRLPAVEALGSATVVCTDKTGTLTAGEMTVTAIATEGAQYTLTGAGYAPVGEILRDGQPVAADDDDVLAQALVIGALTNRAALESEGDAWRIRGDPTEAALLTAAAKAGIQRDALRAELPETGEVPFSSERMLMATFHRVHGRDVAFVKGAPARVIERCTRVLEAGGAEGAIDAAQRERLLERNRQMAERGLRVLAVARGPDRGHDDASLGDLAFVALVGITDPPADGVRETIDAFRTAGIRTLMITGDQKLTATAIARELGIAHEGDEVLDGRELEAMPRDEIVRRLPHIAGLSRVSPEQKLNVIAALQSRGDVVAMLGDGVNDAAALKKADIGVAMGMRGTDVAKEAAGVVLQDDRFRTIGAAVREGRVIFDNIRRFVFYLFSCNLAEVFVILGASIIGLPQPLLPLQILWLNLITDTFPALSLAMEPADDDVMERPPQDPQQAILSRAFLLRIAFYAGLITIVTLAAFVYTARTEDTAHAVSVAFMTLALAQVFHLGTARGPDPVFAWRRASANRWALGALLLTVGLQLLAVYWTPLAGLLDVVPLSPQDWIVVVMASLIPALIGQSAAILRGRRRP